MKVIFLDVDGVLNFEGSDAKAPGGVMGIASRPVKVLSQIVKATGAKIVLASTWGEDWNMNEDECTSLGVYLDKKLRREGLHIMDKIEDSPFRGKAIRAWLDKRPNVTDWIVIDDTEFADYKACAITAHLVKPDFDTGLTENMQDRCVRMLNPE